MKLSKADYVTLLNAFSGTLSIIYTLQADYSTAFIFLIFSEIFDILDGLIARVLNEEYSLGESLDSLSDAVSFITAGPILAYSIVLKNLGIPGAILTGFMSACGVFRLARFNTKKDIKYFIGLATPPAGIFIAALAVSGTVNNPLIFGALSLLVSLLMISRVRYYSPKRLDQKVLTIILFVIALFLVGCIQGNIIKLVSTLTSIVAGAYILIGPLFWGRQKNG